MPNCKILTEAEFMTIVNVVASNNNCEIVDRDFKKCIVYFKGLSESEVKCAIDLEDALGEYTVEERAEDNWNTFAHS